MAHAYRLIPLFLLGSCYEQPADWRDQLVADSPCYRVNLLDGLDEDRANERDDLFACLNDDGHFEPFAPTWAALATHSRDQRPAGDALAALVNRTARTELDVLALAGVGASALRASDRPLDKLIDVGLELTWGDRYNRVRTGAVDLQDATALEGGTLHAAGPLLPLLATAALDDDLAIASLLGDVLEHPDTARSLQTLAALPVSTDARARQLAERLLVDVGQTLPRFSTPANNRYPSRTGNSLRDLLTHAVGAPTAPAGSPDALVTRISPPAAAILGDPVVIAGVSSTLLTLHADRNLDLLLPELAWMASVNTRGAPVQGNQVSALHAFLRLLAATNQPVDCSLDLWVTSLNWQLPNLAVAILNLLADQEVSTVETGFSILSSLMGFSASEWVLDEIASAGVCPAVTHQVLDDLGAIDVMYQPETRDVLVTLLASLKVLKYGQQNRVPELAALAEQLERTQSVPLLEELVRDLDGSPLQNDLVNLVPILINPAGYGVFTPRDAGTAPVDLVDVLGYARWVFAVNASGRSGWQQLAPLVLPVAHADDTWRTVDRLAPLLADDRTRTSDGLNVLASVVALDPSLAWLPGMAPLLQDPQLVRPLLLVVETPGVVETALATRPAAGQTEVPAVYISRLVVDGTLADVLALADTLLSLLD